MKKILKIFFFSIVFVIMAGCLGILICALNPSLTAMLAEKVETMNSAPPAGSGGVEIGFLPGEGGSEEIQPGVNEDWLGELTDSGYEPPVSRPADPPAAVSGRTGYEPVQEEAEQIAQEEADQLADTVAPGDTGSGLTFDGELYPYYAMLERDMQQLYSQIYANALQRNTVFAPVVSASVEQLKSVFEAVYNDHPELFWLETAYSCKYLPNGGCVEITLKYNETAENLEEAKQRFDGAAEEILAGARALGSDSEKEKYIHDALMQSVVYEVSAPMNQSAYSALVNGRSVCAGYARAFQHLMQQLGIPCYYCTGYAGEEHAWNIVRMDGAYRNVDVTWDDTETPTYDYYNKTDREFAPTHMRTGLSVYLPACTGEGDGTGNAGNPAPDAEGTNGNSDEINSAEGNGAEEADAGEEEESGTDLSGLSLSELINPNPIQPVAWQSKISTPVDNEGKTTDERRRESLEKAGITEDQVRDTMQEYYEDCWKLLKEVGKGDQQFSNVIPKSLWSSVEQAYSTGNYWKGYVEGALKDLGVENFAIQIQVQDLGGEYYRLYHNVLTY